MGKAQRRCYLQIKPSRYYFLPRRGFWCRTDNWEYSNGLASFTISSSPGAKARAHNSHNQGMGWRRRRIEIESAPNYRKLLGSSTRNKKRRRSLHLLSSPQLWASPPLSQKARQPNQLYTRFAHCLGWAHKTWDGYIRYYSPALVIKENVSRDIWSSLRAYGIICTGKGER